MRCTAKCKRTGKQCKSNAMRGKDKCRMHGGATPLKKDGRHSKYNPAVVAMSEAYERFYRHGVRSLEEELALTRAFLETELGKENGVGKSPSELLPYIDRIEKIVTAINKTQAEKQIAEAVTAPDAFHTIQAFCQWIIDTWGDVPEVATFIELSNKYIEDNGLQGER